MIPGPDYCICGGEICQHCERYALDYAVYDPEAPVMFDMLAKETEERKPDYGR